MNTYENTFVVFEADSSLSGTLLLSQKRQNIDIYIYSYMSYELDNGEAMIFDITKVVKIDMSTVLGYPLSLRQIHSSFH